MSSRNINGRETGVLLIKKDYSKETWKYITEKCGLKETEKWLFINFDFGDVDTAYDLRNETIEGNEEDYEAYVETISDIPDDYLFAELISRGYMLNRNNVKRY